MFKVSAIVTTYNSERFFRGRLDDLANQSLWQAGDMEVIIVNSGSKQDEHAIFLDWVESLSDSELERVAYIKTKREPMYTAWNRAIRNARGEYVTNANADDRLRPDALQVLSTALDAAADKVVGVYGDCYVSPTPNARWDGDFALAYPSYYPTGTTNWDQATIEVMLNRCVIGNCPLWRKSAHSQCGYFDESYMLAGDYEMWLRFMAHGYRFEKIRSAEPIGIFYHDARQQSQENVPHIIMETRRAQLRWGIPIVRANLRNRAAQNNDVTHHA